MELTTVAEDMAVAFAGEVVHRFDGLRPGTGYEHDGIAYETLPDLGPLLCTFATVNDVHFGETRCGVIEGSDTGPVLSVAEGEEPYPELMNRCAISEIAANDPAAVIVKGDLTSNGTVEEYDRFRSFYEPAFGDRLVVVRGNHESYHGTDIAAVPTQLIELPGMRVALVDTSLEAKAGGGISRQQIEWIGDEASTGDVPMLVMGHHHVWDPGSNTRPESYFGINPDESESLVELVARHGRLLGYFAGHTHRNRLRRFDKTGEFPWVEVASVKDFPGAWAQYRVFEGGVSQVMHRISDPQAIEWTDRTRAMYGGAYEEYAFGSLEERCFVVAKW